jgi:UDP-N-acetyl-D-galactosamine dehydrogenase
MIGKVLSKGNIVIYESTVYPGATEETCIPQIEISSGLKNLTDFEVGYSPERINPGDKVHTFKSIKKVISAQSERSLDVLEYIYGSVIHAGVFRASSIKVAEASKVIENTQRDLNIAFMNELAIIFDRMNIDTNEVIEAASTKWNFLKFLPGLVGGHCIGVDPYYLTHKAETIGYHPQVILAGRRVNDEMGTYIALRTIKRLVKNGFTGKNSRILVLGATFKENCPDLRNSQVERITKEIVKYGFSYDIHDPNADPVGLRHVHNSHVVDKISCQYEAVILAVSHSQFKDINIKNTLSENGVLIDVKSFYDKKMLEKEGIDHWRL